jgi:hypothetical protein
VGLEGIVQIDTHQFIGDGILFCTCSGQTVQKINVQKRTIRAMM